MFGRFIALARGRCRTASAHAHLLPMPPRALARWLPQLGGVLCLWSHAGRACEPQANGLLVEQARLAALHRSRWLRVAGAVTAEGPREWADAVDDRGRVCVRIYLLPGTDYCAWDALPRIVGRQGVAAAAAVPFRASDAQLLRFGHRCLAGLDVLGAEPCAMGRLDLRVAGEIVRHEAVALPAS